MQQKIERHKLDSGFKKRARAVKIPISTIRAIIKNFQSTEKCYESTWKRTCLYRPNAQWEGEFEWPKTLQGSQLENCRKRLRFGVRKPLKKLSNSTYITTCCLRGLQEIKSRKENAFTKKTIFSMFSCQTWLELQMGLASMVRCN